VTQSLTDHTFCSQCRACRHSVCTRARHHSSTYSPSRGI